MKHYLSIISNFGRLSRWRLALDTATTFTATAAKTPRDAATLRGAVLGALSRGEQWQRALLFLQDTRLQRLQLDVISCNGLLSAIKRVSAWPMAAEVLLEMRQGALPSPNHVSFNATIAAAARGAAWPAALSVLQDMHNFHVIPDIVTLGATINALQHDRLWQHVLQLLRDFSEQLVQPDLRAWNGAMTCCTRAEAWRMTLQMFSDLKSSSVTSMEANEVSYNAALSALERGQHWQPVLRMLEEMQQRQVRADVVTFNTSISAMQWGQQWEMALHLFDSCQRRKVEPSDVTIAAVLGACGKGLQWQRSLELFWRQEVSSSRAPKEAAVVSTMAACGQCSQWREVCEHRWEGIGGLINFREACRGLPIAQIWSSQDGNAELGQFAFRVTSGEQQCFAALVRGDNKKYPNYWGDLGDWRLAGMVTGLPPGRYCDLASLTTQRCWDRRRCPREVLIGEDGIVVTGVVPQGDLLALHTGARLYDASEEFVCNEDSMDEMSHSGRRWLSLLLVMVAVLVTLD